MPSPKKEKSSYKSAFEFAQSAERGLNSGYAITPLDFEHDEQIALDFIRNILPIYFFSGFDFLKNNVDKKELEALLTLFQDSVFNVKFFYLLFCPEKDLKSFLSYSNLQDYEVEDLYDQMIIKNLDFVFNVNKYSGFKNGHVYEENSLVITEEFAFLAKDSPVAALSEIIRICSLVRDLVFNRVQHSFDQGVFDRADSFVAEFLIWLLENYPEFSLSEKEEDLIKKYPKGFESLDKKLKYNDYILPLQADMNEHNNTFVHLSQGVFLRYLKAILNIKNFFSKN